MEQAWGGSQALPYRKLLAEIRRELRPEKRCPKCEKPYFPIVIAWPSRHRTLDDPRNKYKTRRWLLCPYCCHKSILGPVMPPHPPTFTPEELARAIELYEAGFSSTKIAAEMHCVPSTLLKHLKHAGVKIRPTGGSEPLRGVDPAEIDALHLLYEKLGWSQKRIAAHLGISESTVASRIRAAGFLRYGTVPRKRVRAKYRKRRRTKHADAKESQRRKVAA